MEFNWLTTFITAAECENFRRTAEILYISQPSVTVHIKALEKEVGAVLFHREGKRIKLTEEGKRYLIHAKELMSVYQRGLEDMKSLSQGYTSQFAIAISPLIADTILPSVLKRYLSKNPNVEINVKIIESMEIEKAVLEEEVDIGLSCLNSTNPELVCKPLYQDEVILVAAQDGRDSESAPPLDEGEVLSSNYLLTNNHPGYWDVLLKQIKNVYPSQKMMKVSQVHITKRFIKEGLGVSFLPISTVRRELLEGTLLEVDSYSISIPDASTYAIMKYEHTRQNEFVEFVSNFRF
jgi:LysR family transcriptional regulator, repressor for citA